MSSIRVRVVCAAVFMSMFAELFALTSGDDAKNLDVEFLYGKSFAMVPARKDDPAAKGVLNIAIFADLLSPASEPIAPVLSALTRDAVHGKHHYGLISVNGRTGAESYRQKHGALGNTIWCAERNGDGARAYLGSSLIMPAAFVSDERGRIIWNGEFIDLPEFLDKFAAGSFDEDDQKKIGAYLSRLESALRSADERGADRATVEVLRRDPANSAALRMRLFMLESTNRPDQAWKLLMRQHNKYPKEKKLLLFLFDLSYRNPNFVSELPALADALLAADKVMPEDLALSAVNFLSFHQRAAEAVAPAGKFVEAARSKLNDKSTVVQRYLTESAAALLASRLGHLESAVSLQTQAVKILEADKRDAGEAKKLLSFYLVLLEQSKQRSIKKCTKD
ncbi:MAG: hypothetical protein PHS41_03005 [Victivallaceae bacterium]|nr:hypothetical protein [Victivallaceae bacterium]